MSITKYADEPHPNNQWEWKRWYIAKTHKPDQGVDLEWLHQCWLTTMAEWHPATEEEAIVKQ